MNVKLSVFRNADDALLVWNVDEKIPDCVGFAVRRELTHEGRKSASWLDNFVGFSDEKHAPGERRPSTEWPFQGFTWTDHEVSAGDSARYRAVPIVLDGKGDLQRLDAQRSDWAEGRKFSGRYQAFFNRGYVMSQFVARYLEKEKLSLEAFKDQIGDEDDHNIRQFLAGELRVQMLALLAQARTSGGEVYAALYELSDPELIDALVALGPRAHIVLANGSIGKKKGEPSAEARKRDQNAPGRARLIAGGVDVEATNRFVSPGRLAHNKFIVFTDKKGNPKTAWTGSTNWTPTGLCTQLNNGLLANDADIASAFLEQWKRLRKAGSEMPKELVAANSEAKQPRADATVWFTRTDKQVDLTDLREVIAEARQGLLFLMFMPGGGGILPDVLKRQQEPGLFVRGVVSELPKPDDESEVDVTIVGDGEPSEHRLDVIQPEGRPQPLAWWAAEATRGEFKANIGYAIVHSKVLVVDPLSTKPTVVTGSHNFSLPATAENDENFVVIRGDRALAEAYAVNVFSAWRHYRARVASGSPFTGLKKSDKWMAGSLRVRHEQSGFWGF